MSTADDELLRACEASLHDVYKGYSNPANYLFDDVLEVLGRIGPVTAWVLALREHRKRVEADGTPLPDQSQWGWKENNHVG